MRRPRPFLLALILSAPRLGADAPPQSEWRPGVYLLGTAERGSGPAYAPPLERLKRDDAASVALGLDGRQMLPGGRIETSLFALAHDPFAKADRGYYFTGRARGTFAWADGKWVLRFEEAPRVQRRQTTSLSDFQRNELWVEMERRTSGPSIGLRVGDRRRGVPNDRRQGFARQGFSAVLAGGFSGDRSWRLEGGPQRYSTKSADGWRFATSLELVGSVLRTRAALRLTWLEPLGNGAGKALMALPTPRPTPTPTEPPVGPDGEPVLPPDHVSVAPPPVAETMAPPLAPPLFSPPPPRLLGPSLVVDPLDSDEGDWDFGRRKQELWMIGTRRLADSLSATLELRAQRERGPDLAEPSAGPFVRRDRIALRASLRRELGRRVALLAEGAWQRLRDDRPGTAYSRTIFAVGLEIRP